MTVFSLIRENAPTIRDLDLLTCDHPDRPYPPVRRFRNSAIVRAIGFFVIFLAAGFVFMSINSAITGSFGTSETSLVPVMAQTLAAVLAYLVITMLTESRIWPLEIAPKRALGLVKGLLLGFILVSFCVLILAIIGVYRIESFNPAYNPWSAMMTIGVGAAVTEEILFRGILLRLFEESVGTWGATIISGLAFGLLHVVNPDGSWWGGFAIAIEAGLLFAAVYALTRSLWWCIGLHFAWNITEGPIWGSIVSGTGQAGSWFTSSWHGPEILTGGSFGLEASVIPVILWGILAVWMLVYTQRHAVMVAPAWSRRKLLQTSQMGQSEIVPSQTQANDDPTGN